MSEVMTGPPPSDDGGALQPIRQAVKLLTR